MLYAVGTDLGSLQAAGAVPKLIRASKTFTGAANLGAVGDCPMFTTTGRIGNILIYIPCTTTLADTADGAEFTIGVTGNTAAFWNGTTASGDAVDLDTIVAGTWLTGGGGSSGSVSVGTAGPLFNNGDGGPKSVSANITMTVSIQAITSGVLEFYVLYTPLSAGAGLALGTGMVSLG